MKQANKICLIVLTAAVITACAPLQQAPLVYSSKQSLGVDFSTATTEQPGLALNLGFKSVDAAYVPVAVAKPCDSSASEATKIAIDCTKSIYGLKQIEGGNNNTDSNIQKDTIENAKKILGAFTATNSAKKTADAAVNDSITNLERLKLQLRDKRDTLTQVSGILPDLRKKLLSLPSSPSIDEQSKTSLAVAQKDVNDAQDKINELTKQTTELDKLVQAASDDLAKRKDAANQAQVAFEKVDLTSVADALKTFVTASTVKTDAYSVFGSFSTNTAFGTTGSVSGTTSGTGTAGGANAGVAIGKIFSTGVASQNLTEGIRTYYERVGLAQMQQAKNAYVDCLKATPARLKQIGLPDDMTKATEAQKQKAEAAYDDCSRNEIPAVK